MVLAIMAYIAAIGFVILMHIKKELKTKILTAILFVEGKSLKLKIGITYGKKKHNFFSTIKFSILYK